MCLVLDNFFNNKKHEQLKIVIKFRLLIFGTYVMSLNWCGSNPFQGRLITVSSIQVRLAAPYFVSFPPPKLQSP